MTLARCPRDGNMLREVETRSMFTKHAGCSRCGILYVLWGNCITRCMTPLSCGGQSWRYIDNRPADKKTAKPVPEKKGTA